MTGSLPLTAADLTHDDIFMQSYAGAHTHLVTNVKLPGIPTLNFRQFSDWHPGGPMFSPVLSLRMHGADGEEIVPAETSYQWRPDMTSRRFEYPVLGELRQTLAYVGEDAIIAALDFRFSKMPTRITARGSVSDKAEARLSPVENGLDLTLRAEIGNAWDAPPSVVRRDYKLRLSAGVRDVSIEGNQYSFEVSGIKPRGRLIVVLADLPEDRLDRLLKNPGPAIRATTAKVNSWLAEVSKPRLSDPHALRTYYNAWFQLWYNQERPEGLWRKTIITPSKSSYGRGIWLWDSAFHIFALLNGGDRCLRLAADQVDVLVENARHHGHLPREVWVGAANPEIQPPGILTWAAMEIHKRRPNKSFLVRIYPGLAQNNDWFYSHKDSNRNGLCEWAGGDSGWDTNPRWDKGEVDAVDLNCWLHLDQMKLAEMADILGKKSDAAKWRAKAAATAELIRSKMWDDRDGRFYDLLPAAGEMIRVMTPAIFWPMFAGIATKEQAARIAGQLKDPQTLWTQYPMPCVARNDPTYRPTDYWRGPTWINLNWVTILGLMRYGYNDLAEELRAKSVEVIVKNPDPREYYDPETGAGLGARNYMWTGALFIVMTAPGEQAKP